jgi:hypothetical protein
MYQSVIKNHWDKTHGELCLQVGDPVLISTVNFVNLGGNKKLNHHFVGHFVKEIFHGNNDVEVILKGGRDLKHPTFPISLVKEVVADIFQLMKEPPVYRLLWNQKTRYLVKF